MNAQHTAESLGLQSGEVHRMDCPDCGHKNTFSVSNVNGTLLWNCFHADCNVSGGKFSLTLNNAADILTKPKQTPVEFVKPKSWSRVIPQRARDFADLAHTSGRFEDLYHDVVKDRLVYPIHDADGKLVDGAGRTLTGARPKWYRYGNYRGGFRIGTSRTAFVVEDIPSAISISDWVTGYALLGTSLRDEHIQELVTFDKVYVALDKDATDKALTYMRALNTLVPTGIAMLDKDLKSMEEEERERTVRTAIN